MAKILIIDDDFSLSSMLAKQVASLGHDFVIANTLMDGLEKSMHELCDVVLLDVRLPDGNGLEFLPRFKNTTSSPEVIIITG